MAESRPTLAAPDDDPYLWLEEIEGEQATAWADARTADTVARLADARYERDRDTLRALLDRPDNLPVPGPRGGLLYNFWRDRAQPRGFWRRTTLFSYRTPAPEWEVLLDLDKAVAPGRSESAAYRVAVFLQPRSERFHRRHATPAGLDEPGIQFGTNCNSRCISRHVGSGGSGGSAGPWTRLGLTRAR